MPDSPARIGAATAQLKAIHDGLRAQLSAALADVDAFLAGGGPVPTLQQHCLSFCGSLHAHHSREDGVFARLADDFPELRPALERLAREHATVAAVNEQLTATIEQLVADPRRAVRLRADLTQLAETLEAHYAYEEAQLGPVL